MYNIIRNKYLAPTPVKWRKIGDSLLAACTFITSAAIVCNYHTLGLIALIGGAVGKFITDFSDKDGFIWTNNIP